MTRYVNMMVYVVSQEITEGINKSAQAVQAAQVGIRQMGALARQQTACMTQVP